jgi:DNA mismatch endonuclease (patch repair protein)
LKRRKAPIPASPDVSVRMKAVRQRDNSQEVLIRSLLHRMGLRYRKHQFAVPGLRRRPDISFVGARVAVFVDGCFWHCCPRHATWPKTNRKWWKNKLLENVARDRDTDVRLRGIGWLPIRVWGHEDARTAANRIAKIVRRRSAAINPRCS